MINKEKHLENAQKFIAKGQVSKAIKEYQSVVAAFPKDVRNRQKLAELLSRDKRNDEAMAEYEAVAKHYTDTGFYLKSIAVFKQMQKLDPSRVDIYYSLGELNEKQGLVGNALTEYRNLVAYYDKHDMPQEAIKVLDKMLALDPDNLNFSAKIAECYMTLGQETEALEKFQEIIETLTENGENSKIIKLYERFIEFCPEQAAARLPLARALLNSGSYDKAIQILKSLLKASPDDLDINRCLSDAYVAIQDFANARLTLKHLLKQHQDDLDLRQKYLRVCIDGRELELARDRLEEWNDDFSQADRLGVLQGFYRELSKLMPDDEQVAVYLSVLDETLAETAEPRQMARPGDILVESPETTDDAVLDAAIDDVEPLEMTGGLTAVEEMTSTDEDPCPDQDVELELELDLTDYEPDPLIDKEPADGPAVVDTIRVAADTADDQESVEVEIELDLERLDDLELELDEDLPDENAGTETDSETITVSEPEDSGADILTMAAADVEDLDTISEVAAPSDFAETYTEDFGLNLQGETDDTEQLDSGYVLTPFDEIDEGIPVALEEGDDGDDSMAAAGIDTMTAEPEALFEAPEPSSLDLADGEEETEHADEAEEPEEIEELEILDDNDESEEIVELAGLEEEEGGVIEDVQELDDLAEVAPDSGTPAAKVDFAAALNLESELEEAQFFLQQGLYDDAEKVVMTLLEYRPGLPELIAKLDEISDARQAAESELASTAFVDLMADLQDEDLLAATDFLNTFEDSPVDDELSQKLVSELDSSDTESHYNLGIAYKEMGLYDEAIAEFQKAAQDPVRSIDCIALTGQCQLEAGDNAAALATFRSGLSHEHINDKGRMTLNFELGMLHQLNGELLEALECFQLVAEKDSFFRDVAMLIKNLRKVLGLDGPEDDDGPQGNRDRVSYV